MMEVIEEKDVYEGKWLTLKKITFLDKEKKQGVWEYVERNKDVKIVTLVCKEKHTNEYLLIKQYRLPVKKIEISFPAGLVDEGETIEEAGLRELKEETGYNAQITHVYGPFTKSAGLTTEQTYIIHCLIDKENDKGIAKMESTEDIQLFWITKEDFKTLLEELPENTTISSNLANYFFGLLNQP